LRRHLAGIGVPGVLDVHAAIREVDVLPIERDELAEAETGLSREARGVPVHGLIGFERGPQPLELAILERSLATLWRLQQLRLNERRHGARAEVALTLVDCLRETRRQLAKVAQL